MKMVDLSERDAEAARHVLRMAVGDQPTKVCTLTDEQIAVLDNPEAPQLVDLLWLSERVGDPPNADLMTLAEEVALRCLVANGDARLIVEQGQITDVITRSEIIGSLVLRRMGNALVRAARATAETNVIAFFYVLDEGLIFEEVVDDNGMHEFGIYYPRLWGTRVADFLDPAQGAGRGEIDMRGPSDMFMSEIDNRPELTQAIAVSNITSVLRDRETPRVATVFSSPKGTYVLQEETSDSGNPDLRLTGISRESLENLVPTLVSD